VTEPGPTYTQIVPALQDVISGHAAIVAAVADHAELDQVKRLSRREGYDGEILQGGAVGDGAGGAPGAATQ
jgi:hypothetical protein